MSSRKSPTQDAGTDVSGTIEPFYTNEDVAVLHNIVLLAEELLPQLPERERLPTNALFGAYFDILPRVGVNADHDSRYARILFKIGGLRGPGTIYEKFEEILARMGIEIEFDHGPEKEETQSSDEATQENDAAVPKQQDMPQSRRRRNSESSAWNVSPPQEHRGRQSSASSFNEAAPIRTGVGRVLSRQKQPVLVPDGAQQSIARDGGLAGIPKENIRTWLASSREKISRGRQRSESRNLNVQIRRRSLSIPLSRGGRGRSQSMESDDFQTQSEITAVTSVQEQQMSVGQALFQRYPFNTTSSSLMQVKASIILQHHLSFLAKRQLRHWRERALQIRKRNAKKDLIALHHDRNTLLQLALESWHNRLLENRQLAETERFFAHLERRSTRARDLYLLHKAFTHWMNCAYDEAKRTSLARRHIIRTRTFNAWRDITAVNELKVRRQVLKKFFSVWKREHLVFQTGNVIAIQKYEDNLVEKTYKTWLRNGWDIKAAIWYAVGSKQRILSRWSFILRACLEKGNVAEEHAHLRILRQTWQIWKSRSDKEGRQEQHAAHFDLRRIASNTIKKWRRETRVIPAKLALQTDIRSRLLQQVFVTWSQQVRHSRLALAVDRLRICREAWTTWRHKVRSQLLRYHINDRVVKEAIYKWILAERSILARRNLDRNVLRDYLQRWVRGYRSVDGKTWAQENLAYDYAVRTAQSTAMSKWRNSLKAEQDRNIRASHLYSSNALRVPLLQWSDQARYLQQLLQWSRDAEFYFLVTKTIKQWRASTESARRDKRKSAYIQTRRIVKVNLARSVLVGWCQKTRKVAKLHSQAHDLNYNKYVIIGMDVFDRWRAHSEDIREMEVLSREKRMGKQFLAWRDRSSAFQNLEVEALVNYQERQQSRVLKRWSLLTLQLGSRAHYAAEIREKNVKRLFRKMFSYWLQRTLQKRPIVQAEVIEPAAFDFLRDTARAEVWSDFGEGNEVDEWARDLENAHSSTPVPGYLSTPSRRMERVTAAAIRFSSTTPKAPLSTRFERQLRAQYPGAHISSARKAPGRSRLSMGEDFASIAGKDAGN